MNEPFSMAMLKSQMVYKTKCKNQLPSNRVPHPPSGDPGGRDAGGRERSHAGHGRGGLARSEGREELAPVLASGGWQLENMGCENPAKIGELGQFNTISVTMG